MLTSGRETDARIARALGWEVVKAFDGSMRICRDRVWQHVPDFSTYPADAIEALESTGEPWVIQKAISADGSMTGYRAHLAIAPNDLSRAGQQRDSVIGDGPTLPLAACAAILAWKEGK